MPRFAVSVLLTYLPPRYRERWLAESTGDLRAPAAVSAVLQVLLALFLLGAGYFLFMKQRTAELGYLLITTQKTTSEQQLFGAGVFALLEYILHPQSLLCLYFTFEGV